MQPQPDEPAPAIQDRTDTGGPWPAVGSLLAMALIGLMLLHACMPARGV